MNYNEVIKVRLNNKKIRRYRVLNINAILLSNVLPSIYTMNCLNLCFLSDPVTSQLQVLIPKYQKEISNQCFFIRQTKIKIGFIVSFDIKN